MTANNIALLVILTVFGLIFLFFSQKNKKLAEKRAKKDRKRLEKILLSMVTEFEKICKESQKLRKEFWNKMKNDPDFPEFSSPPPKNKVE